MRSSGATGPDRRPAEVVEGEADELDGMADVAGVLAGHIGEQVGPGS